MSDSDSEPLPKYSPDQFSSLFLAILLSAAYIPNTSLSPNMSCLLLCRSLCSYNFSPWNALCYIYLLLYLHHFKFHSILSPGCGHQDPGVTLKEYKVRLLAVIGLKELSRTLSPCPLERHSPKFSKSNFLDFEVCLELSPPSQKNTITALIL